jgi:pimeloyl-ACP methyl ester carboxylesterase
MKFDMQKVFIKNRKGQKVSVVVDEPREATGLAFVMHGLGGSKEQPHIETIAEAFLENGYTTVRFDATNSIGESDGKLEDATLTNYFEDLEDVIAWAAGEAWYREPFALAGHSLGGICTALFAAAHPEKVKALAPISTVISGRMMEEAPDFSEDAAEWEKTGVREWESSSQPGIVKRLKWPHVEDRRKYDLLPAAQKLTMPVLLIVGEKDNTTPPEHQKILFEKLPGQKEFHVIAGAEHTFKEKKHLGEIKKIFLDWIGQLPNIGC